LPNGEKNCACPNPPTVTNAQIPPLPS